MPFGPTLVESDPGQALCFDASEEVQAALASQIGNE